MKSRIAFISLMLVLTGCASEQVQPETPAPEVPVAVEQPAPKPVVEQKPEENSVEKYSDFKNLPPVSDRNYRRMTRQRMEEEAGLQETAGSLWVMDGQKSYLFSENKKRREGDPTTVKVEGSALKLIETKVVVITDLLAELEKQKQEAEAKRKLEEEAKEKEKQRLAEIEKLKSPGLKPEDDPMYDPYAGQYPTDPAQTAAAAPAPERKPAEVDVAKTKEEKPDLKEVENIPTRIVEQTKEGLYRVRGQQFLTIKRKPYKVIATGLIRPEDFNDNLVSSSKLIDAQFDVVHVKRIE